MEIAIFARTKIPGYVVNRLRIFLQCHWLQIPHESLKSECSLKKNIGTQTNVYSTGSLFGFVWKEFSLIIIKNNNNLKQQNNHYDCSHIYKRLRWVKMSIRCVYVKLLNGCEGKIWIVGPEEKYCIWLKAIFVSEGPTNHILPESLSTVVLF